VPYSIARTLYTRKPPSKIQWELLRPQCHMGVTANQRRAWLRQLVVTPSVSAKSVTGSKRDTMVRWPAVTGVRWTR